MSWRGQAKWFCHSPRSRSDGASGDRVGALYPIQISVCLSISQTVWLPLSPSCSLLLNPRGFCFPLRRCSALSAVLHSAVFITKRCWFGGGERPWGGGVSADEGGVHCTVGVNTEWCQLSLGPPTSQYSIVFPSFPPSISFFIFQRDRCLWILAPWHWKTVFTSKEKYDFPHIFNVQILDQYQSLSPTDAAYLYLGTLGWLLQ